ncbi:hypothetical protein ACLK12_17800 [Escherichia coli]
MIDMYPLERKGKSLRIRQRHQRWCHSCEFIPGVDKGIREQLKSGPLAGYPVMDLGVRLHFGSYHDVDSSGTGVQNRCFHGL